MTDGLWPLKLDPVTGQPDPRRVDSVIHVAVWFLVMEGLYICAALAFLRAYAQAPNNESVQPADDLGYFVMSNLYVLVFAVRLAVLGILLLIARRVSGRAPLRILWITEVVRFAIDAPTDHPSVTTTAVTLAACLLGVAATVQILRLAARHPVWRASRRKWR